MTAPADEQVAALVAAAQIDAWRAGWSFGHQVGWEHCRDGNYGTDYWDDETPVPPIPAEVAAAFNMKYDGLHDDALHQPGRGPCPSRSCARYEAASRPAGGGPDA